MGIFDGLVMAVDLVKNGLSEVKLVDSMKDLAKRVWKEHKDNLDPDEKELYKKFTSLTKEVEAETKDMDRMNKLIEEEESALAAFLIGVSDNSKLPGSLLEEIQHKMVEYGKSDDRAEEIFEKFMMKKAKTPAQKEEVRKALAEMKADSK